MAAAATHRWAQGCFMCTCGIALGLSTMAMVAAMVAQMCRWVGLGLALDLCVCVCRCISLCLCLCVYVLVCLCMWFCVCLCMCVYAGLEMCVSVCVWREWAGGLLWGTVGGGAGMKGSGAEIEGGGGMRRAGVGAGKARPRWWRLDGSGALGRREHFIGR